MRRLPQFVTKEDFDKLLEVAKKELKKYWMPRKEEYKPSGKRIQQYIIAMCLGFGGGLRISEIFGLQKKQKYTYQTKEQKQKGELPETKILESNIPKLMPERIEEKFIRLKGKGQKDRVVPYPSKIFMKAGITRTQLLKNLPLSVSYRSCELWITNLGKKVLKKHITFHQLRHGFITTLMNAGMPIHQVQIYSGHARMDTLGIYAHANPEQGLEKYGEAFG